jgi:pimeloyl-ACP methyl ester carboxylesterase
MLGTMRLRGRWLERPWGRMRVWEAGAGEPVLAIHGLGGSGRYWAGLARRLGDRWRVVAPDLAGFGRSSDPRRDADRALHLADVDAVIDELVGPLPLTVVGHSLGAVLGALWAGRHPDRTARLALVAAPFPVDDGTDYRGWVDGTERRGRRALVGALRAAWPALSVPIGVARRYPRAVVRDFGRQSLRARAWTLWTLRSDPSLGEEVRIVRVLSGAAPALLLNGETDRTVPREDQDRWADLLPNADRITLPGRGHQLLLRTGFEPLAGWLDGSR